MINDGILCQACGIEAPLKHVEFHQNIGMLMMRRSTSIKGNLCKQCVTSHFWKKTGTTLGVGWLGTISLFIAPVFIIMNVVQYLGAMGMERVPDGAKRPNLDAPAVAAIAPAGNELLGRISRGEPVNRIAREIAPRLGVTPGQVVLYIQWMVQSARQAQQPTYGFPVQPVAVKPLPAIPLETVPAMPLPAIPLPPLPPAG